MGKTSLATAVVHDAGVAKTFKRRRYWVDLEGCLVESDMVQRMAKALPVNPTSDLTAIIAFLSSSASLLCLDDLDALTDSRPKRSAIARVLDRLGSACCTLITLRDAAPLPTTAPCDHVVFLEGLDPKAAAETFCLVARSHSEDPDLPLLIKDCDGLPLAIALLSQLATRGLPLSALRVQWAEERSRLLSLGARKQDNIAISINLSLACPRIASNEDAWNVLRVIAWVSEGLPLSDLELLLPRTKVNTGIAALLDFGLVQLRRSSKSRPDYYGLIAPVRTFICDTVHCPTTWDVFNALELARHDQSGRLSREFELLNSFWVPGRVMLCTLFDAGDHRRVGSRTEAKDRTILARWLPRAQTTYSPGQAPVRTRDPTSWRTERILTPVRITSESITLPPGPLLEGEDLDIFRALSRELRSFAGLEPRDFVPGQLRVGSPHGSSVTSPGVNVHRYEVDIVSYQDIWQSSVDDWAALLLLFPTVALTVPLALDGT